MRVGSRRAIFPSSMQRTITLLVIGYLYQATCLDFKLHHCRFQCSDSCQVPKDKSNPNGDAKSPSAYYWRDFHGVIPPDAFPVGPPTQFPQTYIGLVLDPAYSGIFATTVFDGLDYVYNGNEGNTTKISSYIQILCTKSPEDLFWFKLSKESYTSLKGEGYKVVEVGDHKDTKGLVKNYVVKTNQCHVTYIGVVNTFDAELEYALIDGTYATSNDYMWLMYKPRKSNETSEDKDVVPSKSFFSHHYEYQIRSDSIIPKFYKKISVGSCSVTCTNEDVSKMSKFKNDVQLSSSMAYYWQEGEYANFEEAIPSGKNFVGKTTYVGQAAPLHTDFYDVGTGDKDSATIRNADSNANLAEISYFHILSSNYPDKFKWVNSSTEDFDKLDKKALIPGGINRNGSETYVCRNVDDRYGTYYPGSARVFESGTSCHSEFGPEETFQVLMYQQDMK